MRCRACPRSRPESVARCASIARSISSVAGVQTVHVCPPSRTNTCFAFERRHEQRHRLAQPILVAVRQPDALAARGIVGELLDVTPHVALPALLGEPLRRAAVPLPHAAGLVDLQQQVEVAEIGREQDHAVELARKLRVVHQRAHAAHRGAGHPHFAITACAQRLDDFGAQTLRRIAFAIEVEREFGEHDVRARPRLVDRIGHAAVAQATQVIGATGQHDDETIGLSR